MVTNSVDFDGYTYEADWIRVDDRTIHWTAVVKDGRGRRCGTPQGTLKHQDITEQQIASAVCRLVEAAIRDRVGID